MTALYGVKTYLDSGKVNITPDGAGGVFVQLVTFTHKAGTVRVTFPDLLGLSVFFFAYREGLHEITAGIDGSGYPYIDVLGFPDPTWSPGAFNTVLGVYAR